MTCDDQTHTTLPQATMFEYLRLFFFNNKCLRHRSSPFPLVSCYKLIVPLWKARQRKQTRLGQKVMIVLSQLEEPATSTFNNSSNNDDQTAEQPRRVRHWMTNGLGSSTMHGGKSTRKSIHEVSIWLLPPFPRTSSHRWSRRRGSSSKNVSFQAILQVELRPFTHDCCHCVLVLFFF